MNEPLLTIANDCLLGLGHAGLVELARKTNPVMARNEMLVLTFMRCPGSSNFGCGFAAARYPDGRCPATVRSSPRDNDRIHPFLCPLALRERAHSPAALVVCVKITLHWILSRAADCYQKLVRHRARIRVAARRVAFLCSFASLREVVFGARRKSAPAKAQSPQRNRSNQPAELLDALYSVTGNPSSL